MPALRAERGFTYLGVMFIIMGLGVALASTVQVWMTVGQREKERELLFIGDQFRKAMTRYAAAARNPNERLPRKLEDLLKDPRYPDNRRYLRKIFVDPMTGKQEWGLRKDLGGAILGIYSLSKVKPFKQANFRAVEKEFEGKTKYSDWVFTPKGASGTQVPGAAAGTNPALNQPGAAATGTSPSSVPPGAAAAGSGTGAFATTPLFGGTSQQSP
jgi:type II secretory pathway pseudopilin PulG